MTFSMREAHEDDVPFVVRLFKLPHVRAFLNPPDRGTVLASFENPNVENCFAATAFSWNFQSLR